jgi:hypothetical protein
MTPRKAFGKIAALIIGVTVLSAAYAAEPWADLRFQYRIPLTVSNGATHAFAAGDIVAATVPHGLLAGRTRADGADAALYLGASPIAARVLLMGGSDKVLFALPDALPANGSLSNLTLYCDAPSVSTPSPAPAGLQVFDFRDGDLHGWKSLQDPAGTGTGASDVRIAADSSGVSTLALGTSKYHHPMAFADAMTPVGDATVYAKVRTGGGENEAGILQRFNTQTLTDNNSASYLTGADQAAVGVAVDAYGAQRAIVSAPLGGPEGADGRRHPGPNMLISGGPYSAKPDNEQFLVSATRSASATQVVGKAWQSAPPYTGAGSADPVPGGFQMTVSAQGTPLPAG